MKYTADLPPAGALHEEDPAALDDDGLDRLALALAEGRFGAGDGMKQLEGGVRSWLRLYRSAPTPRHRPRAVYESRASASAGRHDKTDDCDR
jgi:hypothetical protein